MIKLTSAMNEIEKLTSRDNRRLVTARKIRDGKITDQIFIEGRRLVVEALRSDISIDECFIAEGFRDNNLVKAITGRSSSVAEIPERLFQTIADTERSQGIILIAKRPKTGADRIASRAGSTTLPLTLFLNEINNPSNLGAVLRTAEAAGVTGVIVSVHSADVYSPKALRAAMGSSFRLPIWENAGLDEVLLWSIKESLVSTAADISARTSYTQIDWTKPRLLIFGSEAHGLPPQELEKIDELIKIPMGNEVESLNLAVAAGIILFEAKRQNGHI